MKRMTAKLEMDVAVVDRVQEQEDVEEVWEQEEDMTGWLLEETVVDQVQTRWTQDDGVAGEMGGAFSPGSASTTGASVSQLGGPMTSRWERFIPPKQPAGREEEENEEEERVVVKTKPAKRKMVEAQSPLKTTSNVVETGSKWGKFIA